MAKDPVYYQNFTEEQFAADEYFQQWVLHADKEKDLFWSSWLNENPDRQDAVFKARRMVEELAANEYGMPPLSAGEKEAIKENIYRHLKLDRPFSLPGHKKRRWLWPAAAAVLLIAISAYLLNRSGKHDALLVARTEAGETREIVLPDSSVVILNARSSLQYNNDFSKQSTREVYLEGNAFFKVKKDAHKPFIVHASSLAVSVLGTQFNVDARSPAAQVVLTSGKVKITPKENEQAAAYMLPGEKIKWDTLQQSLVKTKTDVQVYSAWTDKVWRFRETTLEDIGRLIREYYGVEVIFKNEKSRNVKMSAVIPVTDLKTFVRVISKTLRVQIEETNSQLLIQ
jgi:ferric-dicitrate binding protein FerR (iron transport regulator)